MQDKTEFFNPFIPMDLKNSALPCAIYQMTVNNTSTKPVKVDVLAAQKNSLSFNEGDNGGAFGKNQNQVFRQSEAILLHMTRSCIAGSDMALTTQAEGASASAEFGTVVQLHKAIIAQGTLKGKTESKVTATGESVNGALSAPLNVAPGESRSVTFALT